MLSLSAGLVTTLIALFITIGLLSAWSGTSFFRWIERLVSPLLSIPHAATALGFAFLLAPSGWLTRMISPDLSGWTQPPDWIFPHDGLGLAMIAGLATKELPFLLLVSLAALPQVQPRRHASVARTLGYGPMAAWIYAVWPRLYAQIRLPVFAVIAYATSVVDVALILGPTNPPTLAVQLTRWMSDPDLQYRFLASAGAILQLGVTLFALLVWWLGEKLTGRLFRRLARSGLRWQQDRVMRGLAALATISAVLVMVFGLAGMALWSFAGLWRFPHAWPATLSLRTWDRQWAMLGEPLINSVLIGGLATLIALIVTIACLESENRARRKVTSRSLMLIYLPLIVPQVAFLFGLQLLFLLGGSAHSLLTLVMSHLIFVLPYIFLSLADPWRSLDPRYAQLSASLGARTMGGLCALAFADAAAPDPYSRCRRVCCLHRSVSANPVDRWWALGNHHHRSRCPQRGRQSPSHRYVCTGANGLAFSWLPVGNCPACFMLSQSPRHEIGPRLVDRLGETNHA